MAHRRPRCSHRRAAAATYARHRQAHTTRPILACRRQGPCCCCSCVFGGLASEQAIGVLMPLAADAGGATSYAWIGVLSGTVRLVLVLLLIPGTWLGRLVGAARRGRGGRGPARCCRFDLRHHPGRALDAAAANHARGRPLALLARVSQLLRRSRGRCGNSDADATFSHAGRGAPHQPVDRHLSRRTLRLWRGFCRDRRDDCHDRAPRSSAQRSRRPANGRGQQPGRPDRDLSCGRNPLPAPGLPRGGGLEHRRQPADLHGQRNLPDPAPQAVWATPA